MKLACVGDGANAGQLGVGAADIPDTDEPTGDLDAEHADRERCPLGSRNPNGLEPETAAMPDPRSVDWCVWAVSSREAGALDPTPVRR